MQHFFVTPSQVGKERIYIEGSDVNHMKNVLRMHCGEELMVSDGNNLQYRCAIEGYEEGQAVLKILEEKKVDKMELIVQKSVELGVYRIIPVSTRRSVVKLDEKKAQKKTERWQQIAVSAAKQAGRGYVPCVAPVVSYPEALRQAEELDMILIPYELERGMQAAKEIIEGIRPGQSIAVFIGPEGGFEKEEVESALGYGAKAITLGRRILRTETAGLAALSILMFHLEV